MHSLQYQSRKSFVEALVTQALSDEPGPLSGLTVNDREEFLGHVGTLPIRRHGGDTVGNLLSDPPNDTGLNKTVLSNVRLLISFSLKKS